MQVYYDRDADLGVLKGKGLRFLATAAKVMRTQTTCATRELTSWWLRRESKSWAKAENAGLKVAETAEAVKSADIVMTLLPDELQGRLTRERSNRDLKTGTIWLSATVLTFISSESFRRPGSTFLWWPRKARDI